MYVASWRAQAARSQPQDLLVTKKHSLLMDLPCMHNHERCFSISLSECLMQSSDMFSVLTGKTKKILARSCNEIALVVAERCVWSD
jgi:hypothetical protein